MFCSFCFVSKKKIDIFSWMKSACTTGHESHQSISENVLSLSYLFAFENRVFAFM